MWKLSFLLLAAPKMALYASVAIAAFFYTGRAQREMFTAEGLATFSLISGFALGIAYLWRLPPRPASAWHGPILVSRIIRIASTIALAYGVRMLFHFYNAQRFYWGLVAIATVMMLATDILVTRRALSGRIGLANDDAPLDAAAD
jgi:hypothetical protein